MNDLTALGTVIGLAIAFIAAGWVAQDAKKRGMSAGGWFIGVLIMLIIFLPLYLLSRKPKLPAVVEQEQLASGGRKCPFCAEIIKIEARVCRFCGRDLAPPVAEAIARHGSTPLPIERDEQLKEDLFQLESQFVRGNVSRQDYERRKDALVQRIV